MCFAIFSIYTAMEQDVQEKLQPLQIMECVV